MVSKLKILLFKDFIFVRDEGSGPAREQSFDQGVTVSLGF